MPDTTNPIFGPYSAPAATYNSSKINATYSRTVRVTATTNNPFTATGSNANPAGFLIMNTGSLFITASSGTGYFGADFHEAGQNHQIFPISLRYVSASDGGDITILYNY
jgi:hypothetical protein